jgi:hypothetical protein
LDEGSARSRENNTCLTNHALEFKYLPGCLKVKANKCLAGTKNSTMSSFLPWKSEI